MKYFVFLITCVLGLNCCTLSIFDQLGQIVYTSNIIQQQEYLHNHSWGVMRGANDEIYNPQGGVVSTKQIVLQ